MTIDALVQMAKRIHDAEGWNLGSQSTRETRNTFWARVIGCAYHGHPTYNPAPDRQWHLKKADATRPQTDDVATSMPSRNHWDCIPGAGADGYSFKATPHGPLPAEQIVYAPPVPDGAGPTPEPVPPPALKPRDQFYAEFRQLNDYYAAPEGLQRTNPRGMALVDHNGVPFCDAEAMGAWGYDLMTGRTVGQCKQAIRQSDEWKQKHPGEQP